MRKDLAICLDESRRNDSALPIAPSSSCGSTNPVRVTYSPTSANILRVNGSVRKFGGRPEYVLYRDI
jgi:hypothetical protein